jgi:AGCS family alanine or glycine:cation symporter
VVIVLGAAMSTGKVVEFSDAMLFSMSFANLIGVYCLLPVVTKELKKYQDFTSRIDKGEDFEKASAAVESELGMAKK